MNFYFSKDISNFDSNAQGVEAMLTRMVKVQFTYLHEQFRNKKVFTIMASKIGNVLEIKPIQSYVKRPTRPMITVEIQDINRLANHIHIPSMAKCVTPKDTTLQKILYFGLPNQCKKCRHFGHFARACTIFKTPIWDGITPTGKLPT